MDTSTVAELCNCIFQCSLFFYVSFLFNNNFSFNTRQLNFFHSIRKGLTRVKCEISLCWWIIEVSKDERQKIRFYWKVKTRLISWMINDSIDIQVRKMKVITVINIFIFYCATAPPSFSAVQPSTFGGFVNSFGRLTNTIKVWNLVKFIFMLTWGEESTFLLQMFNWKLN